jgi:hypothetical protein
LRELSVYVTASSLCLLFRGYDHGGLRAAWPCIQQQRMAWCGRQQQFDTSSSSCMHLFRSINSSSRPANLLAFFSIFAASIQRPAVTAKSYACSFSSWCGIMDPACTCEHSQAAQTVPGASKAAGQVEGNLATSPVPALSQQGRLRCV